MIQKADRLLKVSEVAEILSVAKGTVRKLVASGDIESVKVSNRIRVRLSSLQSFMKNLPLTTEQKHIRDRGGATLEKVTNFLHENGRFPSLEEQQYL